MYIQSLYLYNFRQYKETSFNFDSGINLIYGANATGKTTLLEAIYVLMTGRSFRTPQCADLVSYETPLFYLEASFVKLGIEQKIKLSFDGREKKIFHNSTSLISPLHILGLIPGVVLHPDDTAIVKGSPLVRRHLLDMQISQADPLYIHYLTRYNRAMRQRNHLLRAKKTTAIESWEFEMAKAAAYIVEKRIQTVEGLEKWCRIIHSNLGGQIEELTLLYKRGDAPLNDLSSYYLQQFQRLRKREMELGFTLIGPHKDDLLIILKGKEARFFASEGQQRSCVAALRLAEWSRLKELTGLEPLLLIDDVGISFDPARQNNFLTLLQNLSSQVFLTSTQKFLMERMHITLLENSGLELNRETGLTQMSAPNNEALCYEPAK